MEGFEFRELSRFFLNFFLKKILIPIQTKPLKAEVGKIQRRFSI